MTDETPYDEIDPAIVELCRAINEFPGIATMESCQGFVDGHRPGQPWAVYFGMAPDVTPAGYASIEFLTWVACDAAKSGWEINVYSPPPYLNEVCRSMYFILSSLNEHPDKAAAWIRKLKADCFYLPA
jgi:hypothetical protein